MSTKRHRKYFTVTKTFVVSANNKSEAVLASEGKRNVDADVLIGNVDVHQVRAAEAKQLSSS